MIIVAGRIAVAASDREAYLGGCRQVVELGRAAAGNLEFSISADLLDPGRINILERWESSASLTAFRGSGPSGDQEAQMISADVHDYEVARPE